MYRRQPKIRWIHEPVKKTSFSLCMKWTPNHFACNWGLFNMHITVVNCNFVGCFDRVTLYCIYTSICTHIDHIRFEHRSFIVISSNQRILLTYVAAVVIKWQIQFSSFIIPILTTSCFKRWYQYLHSCVPEHFLCAAVNVLSIDVCKFLIAVNFYLVLFVLVFISDMPPHSKFLLSELGFHR